MIWDFLSVFWREDFTKSWTFSSLFFGKFTWRVRKPILCLELSTEPNLSRVNEQKILCRRKFENAMELRMEISDLRQQFRQHCVKSGNSTVQLQHRYAMLDLHDICSKNALLGIHHEKISFCRTSLKFQVLRVKKIPTISAGSVSKLYVHHQAVHFFERMFFV